MAIRLIASPELPTGDREVLERLEDPVERTRQQAVLVEQMMEDLVRLAENEDDHATRAKVLAWLLANGSLQIRFAFPEHVETAGIFHEKMGVFDLDDGGQIAFTGSANETARGHSRNYESVDVYRSWMPGESERVATKIEQFDEAWDGNASGLSVLAPSPDVLGRLRSVGASRINAPTRAPSPDVLPSDPRWRHQEEAIEALLEARTGVLEMATGTGKTRTAIKLMSRLIDQGEIDSAIVTTDGTDLLEQWALELEAWSLEQGRRWLVLRQFERHRQGNEYALGPERALVVVSRSQLKRVIDRIPKGSACRASSGNSSGSMLPSDGEPV
jgi:hypothetical protein